MQCSNCNQEIVAGSEFCGNCGAKLMGGLQTAGATTTAAPAAQPAVATSPSIVQPVPDLVAETPAPAGVAAPARAMAVVVPKKSSSGLSIAGMVLGILSLLTSFLWIISGPLAVLAIILSAVGVKKGGKGMGIAGIILGVIGVIATVLILILLLGVASKCTKTSTDSFCKGYNSASVFVPLLSPNK